MKKLICVILSLIFVLASSSLIGCGNSQNADNEPENNEIDVIEGEFIVFDSNSNYIIAIPKEPTSIVTIAAGELKTFFLEATGITLQIMLDTQVDLENNKVISIGKTLFATEEIINSDDLSRNSYKIRTYNDDIFLLGGGDYGTLWSVYELLNTLFDYEYYSENTWAINKGVSEVQLYDFDIKKSPEIEWRVGGGAQTYEVSSLASLRFTYVPESKLSIGGYHNSFIILNPEIYNDSAKTDTYHPLWYSAASQQLCYTAHGDAEEYEKMIEEAFKNMLPMVLERSDADSIRFQMQDNHDLCICQACADSAKYYGNSNSAAVIKFCNRLYLEFEKYFQTNGIDREVKIVPFLYKSFEDVPVKLVNGKYEPIAQDIVCKGVIPYYANIQTCVHNKSFTDPENRACLDMFKKINAICDEWWLYGYGVDYYALMLPYNSYGVYQTNMQILNEYGCSLVFYLNAWNQGVESRFGRLQEYLISRLAWDSSLNVEELTLNYFKNVYGAGYNEMLELYNGMRLRMVYNEKVLGAKSGIYDHDQIKSTEMFPMGLLVNWISLIDKAYEKIDYLKTVDIDKYNTIRKNILIESLSPRYIYASLYLLSNETSNLQFKKTLIDDMRNLGMVRISEQSDSTTEWLASEWGV